MPLATSGTVTITGEITDSRGRKRTKTVDITVLAYQAPQILSWIAQRSLVTGTPDENGTYLLVSIDASVSSLVVGGIEKNALSYRILSRLRGSGDPFTEQVEDAPGGVAFDGDADPIAGYLVSAGYDVRLEVFDLFSTSPVVGQIATSAVVFHVGATGVGAGKYNERGSVDALERMYQRDGYQVVDEDDLNTSEVAAAAALAAAILAAVPTGISVPWDHTVAPVGWLLRDGSAVSRTTYAALFAHLNRSIGNFTITLASPGLATLSGHNFQTGQQVYLTTTGALPTGLSQNTNYWVIRVSSTTFRLATSLANALAGTAINTSGSQSGTHSIFTTYGVGNGSTTFNVPDSRGRALVGVDSTQTDFAALGITGGAKTHTLTDAEVPDTRIRSDNAASNQSWRSTASVYAFGGSGSTFYQMQGASATDGARVDGGNGAHNNLQPYQATNWIIKT